jgi:hypothetical protein
MLARSTEHRFNSIGLSVPGRLAPVMCERRIKMHRVPGCALNLGLQQLTICLSVGPMASLPDALAGAPNSVRALVPLIRRRFDHLVRT